MIKIISTITILLIWFKANAQCATPTNLTVTATTASSATLSWLTGGSSNWQVEYGPLGFSIGSGTKITTSSNPFILSNIPGATTFDVYVRDSCSNGSVSSWFGPISFSTSCSGVNQAPLFIDFENADWQAPTTLSALGAVAPCWLANPSPANQFFSWSTGPPVNQFFFSGPAGDHTTGNGKYLLTDNLLFSVNNSLSATARSPKIDLSTINSPQFSFWYHMYGSEIVSLRLEVKDANQTGAWTTIWIKNGQQQTSSTSPWLKDSVSLGFFAGDTIYYRFVGVRSNNQFNPICRMAIDDISIEQGSAPCAPPNNLTISNATPTSITASWVSGGSSTWEIEYGPTGFVQGQGTVLTTSLNPFTITGLTTETSYDVSVREICTGGTTSTWVGPVTQSTPCVNSCTYTLELSDSFGDGWTTSSQSILHAVDLTVGSTTTSYTLPNGSFIGYNITVCESDTIVLAFDNNGIWSNECGIVFKDGAGNIVYSRSPGNNISSGVKWSGSNACSIPCPLPFANFNATINNAQASFNATTSFGSGLFYNWDFGDGNTGLDSATTHTYTAPGFYTVTLVVTDVCGQTDTATQLINAGVPCPTPVAAFSPAPNKLQVAFNATASNGLGLNYSWNYGDGNTGTGINPIYNYAADGTYAVKLTITDACGNADSTIQNIQVCDSLRANYTIGKTGLTVNLDASSSSAGATQWNWNFGDGNTATGQTTSHTYATTGTFLVSLTVVNICGETATYTSLISTCVEPVANWSYQILSSGGNGMTIQFNGSNSTGANSYFWDFGDGNTNATSAAPVHNYNTPGLFYLVSLIVTNDCGDTDTLTATLAQISITEWNQTETILIYPNPSSGRFTIEFEKPIKDFSSVAIYNMLGELVEVITEPVSDRVIGINMAHFNPGAYLIQVNSKNKALLRERVLLVK